MRNEPPRQVPPHKVPPISRSAVVPVSRPALAGTVLLFLAFPAALSAQSIQTISPQKCLWRAGDNPVWAAPSLDESGWQAYSPTRLQDPPVHFWVRCHTDLSSLRSIQHPALQVTLFAAYQIYVDGQSIGTQGNLQSGNFSIDSIRSWPLSSAQWGPAVLALRVTHRGLNSNSGPVLRLFSAPIGISAGDSDILAALRSHIVLGRGSPYIENAAIFGVIGAFAVLLIGLFLYDRTRRDFLLLAVTSLSLAALRLNEFFAASLFDYSQVLSLAIVLIGNFGLIFSQTPFYFAVARKRTPLVVWITLAAIAVGHVPLAADILFGTEVPAWLGPFNLSVVRPAALVLHAGISLVPFVVFWPYSSVARRLRPLAVLCILWGVADFAWFVVEATSFQVAGIPSLYSRWGILVQEIRGFATACVLVGLLGLLFRDQRQVTEDRALLAGELHAAGEIQRMLAPAAVPTAPGVRLDIAFRPMREVGGDFYLCRVLADGRQRVLIGDVSGKGTAAAMTATLLLGGAEDHESFSPGELLTHLDRVLRASRVGGFATCLCCDVDPGGNVTLANAGHLAPYCNGEEMHLDPHLPLGIAASSEYSEIALKLTPGDRVTLLSDGVVEAQNALGELFGFDRTRAISTQSAEAIAQAAQAHGQEDDITVLTVTFAPAEVLHA